MPAGVTNRMWEIDDIVGLSLDRKNPKFKLITGV